MESIFRSGCPRGDLVHDPLIRLVMASDGVSETDLVALMTRVRRAIRVRSDLTRPAGPRGAVVQFPGRPQGH